ncbi:hypothetical protein M0805_007308 [Coniferiporia weirii]|nr:hypothetical protein M0805_007308 [Coniferiporia weirii]
MKLLTPQQEQEHQAVVIAGAAKGFFGGLAVAIPTSYLLQRRSQYYRSLTPALKSFGVILIAVPAFVISAERASLAYEKTQWDDVGKAELDTVESRERARWASMSMRDKAADFAMHHQYSLISGSWAASMLGAYSWISRDKMATTFQKVTQTRVWAQGLTLGIIISAALLTHGRERKRHVDHSWRDMLDREEEAKRQSSQ